MIRFIVVIALTVALWLGQPGRADAQIVFSHSVPGSNGMMTIDPMLTPNGFRTFNSFSMPSRGVMINPTFGSGTSFRGNPFFNPFFNGRGFNNGMGFDNGFFPSNGFGSPFGGFNNNFNMRRWGRW
jgi:hypothetical protein